MTLQELQTLFPRATAQNSRFASPVDVQYNCIAYAVHVLDVWWEPVTAPGYFWPPGVRKEYTVPAYQAALATKGFHRCGDGTPEAGWEKIALYSKKKVPTHAARLLPDGWWASKLGPNVDIEHTLLALRGGQYGNVEMFLRKKL